ncbi:hypothetical protein MOTC310_14225 [Methylobacterium oryzae]|uniref:Uncharacterized protein n=1 Tax=Methylobacterium oryzae TaxID=334852 RepID=A0ABU7TPE8_9HYPH
MDQTSTGIPTLAPARGGEAFRAFFVAPNGRVLGMEPLEASSEADARLLAEALVADAVVELWAGLRLVARFETGRCQPRAGHGPSEPSREPDGSSGWRMGRA